MSTNKEIRECHDYLLLVSLRVEVEVFVCPPRELFDIRLGEYGERLSLPSINEDQALKPLLSSASSFEYFFQEVKDAFSVAMTMFGVKMMSG